MEVITKNAGETKELATKLAKKLKGGEVILLFGDLGSGKTTFTRHLVEALKFDDRVQSPTFVVVRNYTKSKGEIKKIYHVDLYRLSSVEEVDELGLHEFISEPGVVSIIEWPELIMNKLGKPALEIKFEYLSESERKINIHGL